ncbi:hypothetical protein A2696_01915 [Candidatus Curtissbacteria bacterium RIFCSPHIGHO2_01_FULL_41_13]|uniref:MGS-like domain-containing protein n=1 Tax=Candidatus Curtissbacteria bacterium RIFCSPHIGHO2_01_FULL_41_13 TaxID=1797745 RepID=A0A1F5FY69_9BACT|nr:MAG: hypothetical protein A2696_01915 [Candidatus Curtissbacteria bacterium RIFCSPHIGHO2_01_FULL_41_13]
MDEIKVRNIFAAVSDKSILDSLLGLLDPKSVQFWGTTGTVKYLKSKAFDAQSVVSGFDFDGRVKSLDRAIFARILADRSNKKHLEELRNVIARSPSTLLGTTKQSDKKIASPSVRDGGGGDWAPFDLVIVDLYPIDKNNFPESMDIGGQALIRAAIKNYKNVAVAFDKESFQNLTKELKSNHQSTTLDFRYRQALKATKFITERCITESELFKNHDREKS